MSTHNIQFLDIKKKISLNYPKFATMGFVPRDPRTSSKQPWESSTVSSNSAEEATDSQYVLWAQWAGADIFSEGKIIYKYLSCTCFKIPLDNRGMVT